MKTCSKCGAMSGLQSYCKPCKRLWSQTPKAKLAHSLSVQKYQKTEKGKISLRRKDKSLIGKARHRRYEQSAKGQEIIRANKRKRRDRQSLVLNQYSAADERITRMLFDNQCFNCDSKECLEIDHHYPLSRGFALTLNNAVLLCKSCNASKYDRMPSEFYDGRRLDVLEYILALV